MTRDDALAKLDEVRAAMHEQFGDEHGTHEARLAALDSALASAAMHVEHLHDEEAREIDLAQRIVARETVHGGHEVTSPVGRNHKHTLAIAGRA